MLPLAIPACAAVAPPQRPMTGRVERISRFASRFVDPRSVDVWLPADYEQQVRSNQRFAVLYMHDGQMLFDDRTTWNHQSWHVDVAAEEVMRSKRADPFIIVGIWNNGALRHSEYFPARFLPHLPDDVRSRFVADRLAGKPRSDEYLRFLVEELKPAIDAKYATRPQRDHCFLAGSSMGGLISLYGLCEHPRVFAGAACLSTHWIGTSAKNTEFPDAAIAYLSSVLPSPGSVRLWLDRGTIQLDALYDDAHAAVSRFLSDRGYGPPACQSHIFEGAGHNEQDWSRRVGLALRFLFDSEAG
jgi:predicted alpha/beta superfamily hydrolase